MHLVRYIEDGGARVGVRRDDGSLAPLPFGSLAELLRLPVAEIRAVVEADALPSTAAVAAAGWAARLLAPVDGRMEVWASGVTYRRSREARMEESDTADVYWRVYEADRPELFFKSVAWRVVTNGEPIGIRTDSTVTVPEPELAVVANRFGEIVGYTVCDDVSSRSIEGENPLYLPQAKVYDGACALSNGIRPAWEIADPLRLRIACTISRGDTTLWTANASSADLNRTPADLLSWLFRQNSFPDGVVLTTGTGLVPDLDVTLVDGDTVHIAISEVGQLTNTARSGLATFGWQEQTG